MHNKIVKPKNFARELKIEDLSREEICRRWSLLFSEPITKDLITKKK